MVYSFSLLHHMKIASCADSYFLFFSPFSFAPLDVCNIYDRSVPSRCGQETRVIPRILQLRSHWMKSEKESVRLVEAGITKEVLNSAIAQFCLEIIAKHGDPAPRLCNKDPLTLKMGSYVIELFPEVSRLMFEVGLYC
uniref:Protein-tyrosine sulfotransferase n=1 Tax=Culex pipiens TaxID=7175 RepID=A0A8D8BSN9_CULPI